MNLNLRDAQFLQGTLCSAVGTETVASQEDLTGTIVLKTLPGSPVWKIISDFVPLHQAAVERLA